MLLSDESLAMISSSLNLEGTGEVLNSIIYGFLEKYVPSLLGSITNVHINGAHRSYGRTCHFLWKPSIKPRSIKMLLHRDLYISYKEGHFRSNHIDL